MSGPDILKRFFDDMDRRNWDATFENYSDDCRAHAPGAGFDAAGREDVQKGWSAFVENADARYRLVTDPVEYESLTVAFFLVRSRLRADGFPFPESSSPVSRGTASRRSGAYAAEMAVRRSQHGASLASCSGAAGRDDRPDRRPTSAAYQLTRVRSSSVPATRPISLQVRGKRRRIGAANRRSERAHRTPLDKRSRTLSCRPPP